MVTKNHARVLLKWAGVICCCFALGFAAWAQGADRTASVYLSEVMADDPTGLKDNDGERSGWIEICNGANAPINLGGWFLTNSRSNLTKWRFPAIDLLPDMYLIVFASGKSRTNVLARLQTNFRLAPPEVYLALVDPATNRVSELVWTNQAPGTSYGRLRGESAINCVFLQPTPGRPNATQGPGFAQPAEFSQSSGTFITPFTLKLSHPSSNAIIRFTLNGSLPTNGSPIYTIPLVVTNSVHLRARVYQDGLLPGPPQSETYLLLHSNLVNFSSSLPLLIMDTLGDDHLNSARGSSVKLLCFEPVQGRTSLTNRPTLATSAAFHTRGSSSMGEPQPAFAVQCVDEFNHEHRCPILGLPADSDWVLYGPTSYEPVMIHNPFIHELSRELGRYSPRTRFIEVYLTRQSGPVTARHYHGVYVLEEKIKISPNRVDINRLGPDDLLAPAITGGYLLKIDRLGPDESGFYAAGASVAYVDPKESVINLAQRAPQRKYIADYLDEFERALESANWRDPALGYRAYLEVDAAIDYHVLEVLSGNVDALVLSTFFYKPRNGKVVFGPHWDFDRALGSTDGRDDNPRHWNTGRFFSAPIWSRLFRDPDFWQQWVDRWQELRRTHFSQTNLFGLIDRLADDVREAQPRQVKRWGIHPRGGSYQDEVNLMKEWLSNRVDFIDGQLVQPPRLNHEGGTIASGFMLTLTGPANASIYYTLNGFDPRQSRGDISSNAQIYGGPFALQTNASLVARAYNPNQRQMGGPRSSSPWSAPLTATFMVSPARNP
jgi:hypothetical protein